MCCTLLNWCIHTCYLVNFYVNFKVQQVSIPVGCVLPSCQPYGALSAFWGWGCLPTGELPGESAYYWGLPSRAVCLMGDLFTGGGLPTGGVCLLRSAYPFPVDRQTHIKTLPCPKLLAVYFFTN